MSSCCKLVQCLWPMYSILPTSFEKMECKVWMAIDFASIAGLCWSSALPKTAATSKTKSSRRRHAWLFTELSSHANNHFQANCAKCTGSGTGRAQPGPA